MIKWLIGECAWINGRSRSNPARVYLGINKLQAMDYYTLQPIQPIAASSANRTHPQRRCGQASCFNEEQENVNKRRSTKGNNNERHKHHMFRKAEKSWRPGPFQQLERRKCRAQMWRSSQTVVGGQHLKRVCRSWTALTTEGVWYFINLSLLASPSHGNLNRLETNWIKSLRAWFHEVHMGQRRIFPRWSDPFSSVHLLVFFLLQVFAVVHNSLAIQLGGNSSH